MIEFYPIRLESLNQEKWDELVEESGTVFHHSLWLHLWEQAFPFSSSVYVATEDGEILGGIPFCHRQKYRFKEAYSMPRGSYGGVVLKNVDDFDLRTQLESEFTFYCLREGYTRINIIEFSPELNTNLEKYDVKPVSTHLLNLKYSSEDQLKKIAQSHRRSLPKAFEQGFSQLNLESSEQLEQYFDLVKDTADRQKREPFYRYDFYQKLWDIFSDSDKLYWPIVYSEDRMLASAIVFIHNKSAIYWDGASTYEARERGANFHLFWNLIQMLKEMKIEVLDFGASPQKRPGLKRFKSGWGAERFNYFEYNYQKPISKLATKVKGFF